MSDFVAGQIRAALRSLPWYIAVPAVLVIPVSIALFLLGDHGSWAWNPVWAAAGVGLFVWGVRQAIRLLITVRMLTR